MNDQLLHIFDESACLTKKQLREYVSGNMTQEECHAVEVHLCGCPLCGEAVDGLMMSKEDAAELLTSLNPSFIKEHLAKTMPQIHLNSMAPPASLPQAEKQRSIANPVWKITSLAAALVLGIGFMWYWNSRPSSENLAQDLTVPAATTTAIETDSIIYSDRSARANTTAPSVTREASPIKNEKEDQNYTPQTQGSSSGPEPHNPQLLVSSESKGATDDKAEEDNAVHGSIEISAGEEYRKDRASEKLAYGNSFSQPSNLNFKTPDYKTDSQVAFNDLQQEVAVVQKTKAAKMLPASAQAKPVQASMSKETAVKKAENNILLGNAAYSKKNYNKALTYYNRETASTDEHSRQEAKLSAARCHIELGNTSKAKALLQQIIAEGNGAQKRKAKSLLRQMEREEEQ